jgi:hypothetical protein
MRTMLVTLALAGSLAACGGGGSALEGIYTPDVWTDNPSGCDAPGGDVLSLQDSFFYIKKESFLGTSFLNVVGCDSQADCAAMASDEETLHLGQFLLDKGNDDDGWTGTISYSFGPTGGTCSGGVSEARLTTDGETAVSIRVETKDVPSFPPRGDDCEPDDAVAAAEGLPCTSLETAHLTFTAEL